MTEQEDIHMRIEEFKERMKTELEFCHELFRYATVRLLASKYAYYECSNSYEDDVAYDLGEKSWYVMGRALNVLTEDETSPCVDWDSRHPLANEAIELANRLMRKR